MYQHKLCYDHRPVLSNDKQINGLICNTRQDADMHSLLANCKQCLQAVQVVADIGAEQQPHQAMSPQLPVTADIQLPQQPATWGSLSHVSQGQQPSVSPSKYTVHVSSCKICFSSLSIAGNASEQHHTYPNLVQPGQRCSSASHSYAVKGSLRGEDN